MIKNFQYNSSKTVGKVCHTKLHVFCTQIYTHGYIDGRTERLADSSIPSKTFILWGLNKRKEK